jgi:beta-phosphoglucomutase-like phosphatase (HAD superfamily)
MVKGVIFDFNGTLFWDSKLHEKAWRIFALKFANKQLSDTDFKHYIHGRINRDIIKFVFDKTFTDNEIQNYSDAKEEIYRSFLLADKNLLILAPGAIEILDYLIAQKIPFTIATSAEISNVEFYYKNLNLGKWFDFNKIIYDNGKIVPKPAPDIFLKASAIIGIPPENCLVVEDSLTGIKAAHNARIGKIIFIENDEPIEFENVKEFVEVKIYNLLEIKKFIS